MTVIKEEYISDDITAHDLLPLSFLKKTRYTGEKGKMRFLMEKSSLQTGEDGEGAEETKLRVCVWPEPFAYDRTEEDLKQDSYFEFSDSGIEEAIKWLNTKLHEF